ncbi:hypothetical protein GUITHDRAFT_119942 [Guillardia theta CCMP2712]|uniref:Uncharacterized protein n=2 Tax=Guillardia theta TaxID=55529 RepID=L1ICU5_GUITC|nr:hypothetical protein GUITHDRAFT_119942 [Guillardia theta CCMP2712]EKX33897.1 hypothetical protein GUITHDRAFT_119942 [Guillardia theta CCMP2712]|mmetsp:Transcript_38141/g.120131  ORF Transcript_38141/g.120131 Transcript_38141/m.120131 type:complete len:424 (+) Transcript_38141:36-1307(+)|eukprot:XP_005820877.1 hypothetical protein GUITHDRAFT_119942 [Guillardia theta CCMP2712]
MARRFPRLLLVLCLLLGIGQSRCLLLNGTETFLVSAVLDLCRGSCESRSWWKAPEGLQAQEGFLVQAGVELEHDQQATRRLDQLDVQLSIRDASLALLHLQDQHASSTNATGRRWFSFHAPPLPAGVYSVWLLVFFLDAEGPRVFSSSSSLTLIESASYARSSKRSQGNASSAGISLYRKFYQEEEEETLELRVFGLVAGEAYELEVEVAGRGTFLLARRETLRVEEKEGEGVSHFISLPPSPRGVYMLKATLRGGEVADDEGGGSKRTVARWRGEIIMEDLRRGGGGGGDLDGMRKIHGERRHPEDALVTIRTAAVPPLTSCSSWPILVSVVGASRGCSYAIRLQLYNQQGTMTYEAREFVMKTGEEDVQEEFLLPAVKRGSHRLLIEFLDVFPGVAEDDQLLSKRVATVTSDVPESCLEAR